MAIFWPTSLCNGQTKCRYNTPPDRFTIHGPWALYRDPPGPDHIDWNTFPEETKTKMEQDWLSYSTRTNQQFWDHEWETHGKFSGLQPPAHFDLGLSLFSKVNLGKVLKDAGKYPEGQTVDKEDFNGIVSKLAGGKKVILLCNKDKEGVVQLFEVDVCVDHATAEHDYADCPPLDPGSKSLCPDSFRLTKAAATSSGNGVIESEITDELAVGREEL
ncbi:intracellular ribonuclease LX-like [Malania oleifera]|uniref:intracellular ribonuclease LX-like n=1 Tax=Malania oleifera TaxID=397392 RepID=UPI0025AE7514|nr:intracellular ribonuclease LX-like [Malania oleifera]